MNALQATTYSAASTTGAFDHPLAGTFQLAGINQGAKQYLVKYETTRTVRDTSSDGAVMISYVPGASGGLSIECQQTSALHQFLLTWTNLVFTAADAGDVENVAAAVILLRNGRSQHILTGVAPTIIPEKAYAGQGGYVRWELLVAHVVSI